MTSYYAHSKPIRSTLPEDSKKELILDILRYGPDVEVLGQTPYATNSYGCYIKPCLNIWNRRSVSRRERLNKLGFTGRDSAGRITMKNGVEKVLLTRAMEFSFNSK